MIQKPKSPPPRLAVVVSRFNPKVTEGLLRGALARIGEEGLAVDDADIHGAPGAFEIPLIAQHLARSGRYDGVVCLGCVVKGETAHFEFISLAASLGLMNAGLSTGVPLAFGILTVLTGSQARARSRPNAANKGREAAAACIEAIRAIRRVGPAATAGRRKTRAKGAA